MKLIIDLEMPQREKQETECEHCNCLHLEDDPCEGLMPYRNGDVFEESPVESEYLQKALAEFKKKKKEDK